jgi:hypothetical protein
MEKTVVVTRSYEPQATRGILRVDDKVFHTLEPPWRNNQNGISCILPGEYIAKFLERSTSGRYRNVYWLQAVPGRSGILIHAGNVPAHTEGCILIGRQTGILNGMPAVLNSKSALSEFVGMMQPNDFRIFILGDPR